MSGTVTPQGQRPSGATGKIHDHYREKFAEKLDDNTARAIAASAYSGSPALAAKPQERPFPPPPHPGSIRPLTNIVVLPQRRPGERTRGFAKLYAPLLESCGIDEATWEGFVKSLNDSLALSPTLTAISAGLDIASIVVPSWEFAVAAPLTGLIVDYVNAKNGKVRGNAYLEHANQYLFQPRGLIGSFLTVAEYRELTAAIQKGGRNHHFTRGLEPEGQYDDDALFDVSHQTITFPRIIIKPDDVPKDVWEGGKFWPCSTSLNDPGLDPHGILAPLRVIIPAVPKEKKSGWSLEKMKDQNANKQFARRSRREDNKMLEISAKGANDAKAIVEKQQKKRASRDKWGWGPMFFVLAPLNAYSPPQGSPPRR
ncbi:hypothetical protein BOTBODRAFT_62350 [Botryobasidium botryosum FD-172 SS1]|uniref:Uncharacterized protein n=1 Tax=Botryobasidium botryosum (strain FD-172 SS1) TaxID=930990 RepID=A0A067MWJ9_BOTB1|nr:hypothetical protein BOTBODRAFT_62350 [Botryobasidium botryosum FD-172 SS1]